MRKFLFLFILAITSLCANAQQEIDGIYYNLNSDSQTTEVTENYDFYAGKIVIPETVTFDGVKYAVKSIGDCAFAGCIYFSTINSEIEDPFVIFENTFDFREDQTL